MVDARVTRRLVALTGGPDETSANSVVLNGLDAAEAFERLTPDERRQQASDLFVALKDTEEFRTLCGFLSMWKIADVEEDDDTDFAVGAHIGPHTVALSVGFTPAAIAVLAEVE